MQNCHFRNKKKMREVLFLLKHDFIKNDILSIIDINSCREELSNATFLITGATGLLGSMICRALSYLDHKHSLNLKIITTARNIEKAKTALSDAIQFGNITFIQNDIITPMDIDGTIDYIIHTACPTASNMFVNNPVETILSIVDGTSNIMNLAKKCNCKSVVYLSSMEAYGQILHENLLKPEDVGYVNPLSLRSSYPEGKRMAENLCIGYFSEYHIPVKIIRLAQTFGPGIPATDTRVFAQFLHSVQNGEDIVMFTEGGSKRMYLDTMDAVSAVLTVLLKGESGQVYNAGNKSNYSSIREMAELVIKEFGKDKCKLIIDKSKDVGQYPPDNMLRLDVAPLEALGWNAKYSLKNMYSRMIETI